MISIFGISTQFYIRLAGFMISTKSIIKIQFFFNQIFFLPHNRVPGQNGRGPNIHKCLKRKFDAFRQKLCRRTIRDVCRPYHKSIHFAHAQSQAKWHSTTEYCICGSENCKANDKNNVEKALPLSSISTDNHLLKTNFLGLSFFYFNNSFEMWNLKQHALYETKFTPCSQELMTNNFYSVASVSAILTFYNLRTQSVNSNHK